MEVTSSPELLVEEAKVRGTKCLECPRVDQDLRLLAGVADLACATVCEDSYISPCVGRALSSSDSVAVGPVGLEGTLSSSDLAGMLFPAVPAGIPFPVGPVGPHGTLSPSDSESVGPYGTLSPSATVAVGPVGPYGTLSPSDSDSAGPYGTLSPSATVAVGPVGPYGTLSPSDSDSVGPCGTLSPTDTIARSPV